MNNTELAYQIEMLTQTVGRLCEAAHLDGMLEFPKQKDIKKQPVFTCLQNTDV